MLFAHVVVNINETALYQREGTFHGVCMNRAPDIFLCAVTYAFMPCKAFRGFIVGQVLVTDIKASFSTISSIASF